MFAHTQTHTHTNKHLNTRNTHGHISTHRHTDAYKNTHDKNTRTSIWKVSMPMIWDARRVRDCLPLPPTPTHSM